MAGEASRPSYFLLAVPEVETVKILCITLDLDVLETVKTPCPQFFVRISVSTVSEDHPESFERPHRQASAGSIKFAPTGQTLRRNPPRVSHALALHPALPL